MDDQEKSLEYRKAADEVWQLAKEYERRGMSEIAREIKTLAGQLHDLARREIQ